MEKMETSKKSWSGGKLFAVGILILLISRLFSGGLIGDVLMIFGVVMAFGGLTRINWKAEVFAKNK